MSYWFAALHILVLKLRARVQQTQNTPSYHEGWRWCPLAATERQHLNNITVTFSTKVEDTAAYTAPSSVSRLVEMQHRAVWPIKRLRFQISSTMRAM